MTQEEKELLLKDFCSRLPYNVIVDPIDCGKAILIGIKDKKLLLFDTVHKKEYDKPWRIEYVKPYLRPMSSMTEEEEREYNRALTPLGKFMFEQEELFKPIQLYKDIPFELYEFFNSHLLDYRGLIPMGLAIEVTEKNNPYKKIKLWKTQMNM